MWTIGTGQTLKNFHHNTATYTWGLQETTSNSGIFYIKSKDKAKCKTETTWYQGIGQNEKTTVQDNNLSSKSINQGRKKRATDPICSLTQTCVCPTQTHMGHEIKAVEFEETNSNQKWKLDQYGIKTGKKDPTSNFFRLCLEDDKAEVNKTCVSATTNPNEFESKQNCRGIIAANVENFRTFEGNTRKVISVLLGFFVATIIKRWWDQTSKIPRLDKLAISLNAIMQEGKSHICKKNQIIVYNSIRLRLKLKLCFDSLVIDFHSKLCWLILSLAVQLLSKLIFKSSVNS